MKFEWDSEKAESNFQKHKVSFYEAATIFEDSLSETFFDPDHSITENRFITIGLSKKGKVLVVIHSDRKDSLRIISARKATTKERKFYEKDKKF